MLIFSVFGMQETMEDIDKNGDGFIDLNEYIGRLKINAAVCFTREDRMLCLTFILLCVYFR